LNNICPVCMAYMLDFVEPTMAGWKKCPCCGYCHDRKGDNLVLKAARDAALDLLVAESERLGLYGDELPTLCKKPDRLDQPCECDPECNPLRKD
jgi:hypothetical protein